MDQDEKPHEDEDNLDGDGNKEKKKEDDIEKGKIEKTQKIEKLAEDKEPAEHGKNDGQKDYKSEVNVCINTKEMKQLPSKIGVKPSAEISAE